MKIFFKWIKNIFSILSGRDVENVEEIKKQDMNFEYSNDVIYQHHIH